MNKTAVITGADGGMGREITKAVAKAGYTTIMASFPSQNADQVYEKICAEINVPLVLHPIDLASTKSMDNFVEFVKNNYGHIDLLINNAGVLNPKNKTLEDKWDYTTMVNYFGHYYLTNKLLSSFRQGARIVNVVSLTYRFGAIDEQFFQCGRNSLLQQIKNYSNSKLALLYYTLDLAEQLKEKQITVNCSDPGIVGTKIIAMNNSIFDIICDVFARPFMKSTKNGAKTTIYLALEKNVEKISGGFFKNTKQKSVLKRVLKSTEREILRKLTQDLLHEKNILL